MAVEGLLGFGLAVPDLAAAERFYHAFGLEAASADGTLVLNAPGRTHGEAILLEDKTKRLHHLSFAATEPALAEIADRLATRGMIGRCEPPARIERPGLWFQDPWGIWINVAAITPARPRPAQDLGSNMAGRAERVDLAAWRSLDRNPKPRRPGHVIVFLPDLAAAESFYTDILGLMVTGRIIGRITFMGSGRGDHHCFGICRSTHPGFQHASFEMGGIDDIAFGAERMRDMGYGEGFGLGRHAVASNLFYYARDPWGSWAEYYADMDKIGPGWVARDWDTLPIIWGPKVTPDFYRDHLFHNCEEV